MSATSASARYDAARKVLATYGTHDPKTTAVWGTDLKNGRDVEPYSLTETAAEMAAALRALVEPAATEETPEQIAFGVLVELDLGEGVMVTPSSLTHAFKSGWLDGATVYRLMESAVQAGIQAGWNSWEPDDYASPREPEFAREGEPDQLRDLFNENMPRVSGCMYFAIPGEQPIHVDDDAARHILAYLSERNR